MICMIVIKMVMKITNKNKTCYYSEDVIRIDELDLH